MGGTDAGSHPGGAKKLLTGVDGGGGESLDRYLARSALGAAPFRHVYLGAMATQNNASGDKFISYPSAGTTAAPEDDPMTAFGRLFGSTTGAPSSGTATKTVDPVEASIIDAALGDMNDLRARLGDVEKAKLDLHLEALRDVERRVKGLASGALPACNQSLGSAAAIDTSRLYDPSQFPEILRAQIDVAVQAMACGLTKVAVVQASQHTSELIMSRFPATPHLPAELRHAQSPGIALRSGDRPEVRGLHEAAHVVRRAVRLPARAARGSPRGRRHDARQLDRASLQRDLRRQHALARRHALHPRRRRERRAANGAALRLRRGVATRTSSERSRTRWAIRRSRPTGRGARGFFLASWPDRPRRSAGDRSRRLLSHPA